MAPVQVSFSNLFFVHSCDYFISFEVSPKRFQRIRVNLTSESDSDDTHVPKPATMKPIQNGVSRSQPNKNPVVLEKERQMRFLLEHFPKTEAMVNLTNKPAYYNMLNWSDAFRKYTICYQSISLIRI